MKITQLFTLLLCLFVGTAYTQTNIKLVISKTSVDAGANGQIAVKCADFDNITGTSFDIVYDPAVIGNIAFESSDLPGFNATTQFSNPTPGTISLAWDDASLNPQTLADSTNVLVVSYSALGAAGTSTVLTGANGATIDDNFNEGVANITNGSVSINAEPLDLAAPGVTGASFCPGDEIPVTINYSGTQAAGNKFQVELSDASGSFSSATQLAEVIVEESGETVNVALPGSYTAGFGYRIRVKSTVPVGTSADNGANLTLGKEDAVTLNATICDNETYTQPNGSTTSSTQNGTAFTLQNQYGCDSVVTVNLTVNPTYAVTQNPTVCQSPSGYTLPSGTVVYTSGTYTSNLTAAATGCDSIITTNLTVNPSDTIYRTEDACEGETINLPGGSTTTTAGTFEHTFTNQFDCDSLVITTAVFHPSYNLNVEVQRCEGDEYTLPNSTVITDDFTGTFNLTSQFGCDSVLNLTVSFVESIINNLTPEVCENETYELPNGVVVLGSNLQANYSFTFESTLGCDSIVNVTPTVNPTHAPVFNPTICGYESYTLPDGRVVNTSGTYTSVYTNRFGCDSIITTNLTVQDSLIKYFDYQICDGDAVTIPNIGVRDTAGTFIYRFANATGCDSFHVSTVRFGVSFSDTTIVPVCFADTFNLPYGGGQTDTSGVFVFTFKTVDGCDSLEVYDVRFGEAYNFKSEVTICAGQKYMLADSTFVTDPGLYETTLTTAAGCDSSFVVLINHDSSKVWFQDVKVCNEDTLFLGNDTITTNQTYKQLRSAPQGCDSLYVFNIQFLPQGAATFSLASDTLCLNEGDITLAGGSPAGGVYSGPGVSNGVFNGENLTPGLIVITYTYTNDNICQPVVVSDTVFGDICTGIADVLPASVQLIPNPAKDAFTIQGVADVAHVEIVSLTGKILAKPVVTEQINIEALSAGVYVVKVTLTNGSIATKRLVKE